jgi:thiosulfate reductase cytochrome b subunit
MGDPGTLFPQGNIASTLMVALSILPNIFTWLFRIVRLQSGWYFLLAHSICIHRFFSLCLICMLNACLTYLLLSLCTNMWRRSRAPCSCLNCILEELENSFKRYAQTLEGRRSVQMLVTGIPAREPGDS